MQVELEGRLLAIDCNVSGLKTVALKPKFINSWIGVRKVANSRAGDVIRISVQTSVLEKGMNTECSSVYVSDYPSGKYQGLS